MRWPDLHDATQTGEVLRTGQRNGQTFPTQTDRRSVEKWAVRWPDRRSGRGSYCWALHNANNTTLRHGPLVAAATPQPAALSSHRVQVPPPAGSAPSQGTVGLGPVFGSDLVFFCCCSAFFRRCGTTVAEMLFSLCGEFGVS